MSLAEKLDKLREGAVKRVPADKREMMGRATRELRDSGILERSIDVGDPLPPFSLHNSSGALVRSSDLLARGAVVLTVFRGSW